MSAAAKLRTLNEKRRLRPFELTRLAPRERPSVRKEGDSLARPCTAIRPFERSKRIGNALLDEANRMFVWWHRVRDGTLTRSTFRVYMRSVRRQVEALLTDGVAVSHSKTAKTCAKMLKSADAFWTFVEGVEPTNTAERAVRHSVLWRKNSFGTHSAEGSRFVERILTTHATLRQQGRPILDFLNDACAALHDRLPPSLLPQQSTCGLALAA